MKNKARTITNHKPFRIPIALHIYSSLILISLMTVVVIGLASRIIIQSYIASECNNRISNAVNSCKTFAEAFKNSPIGDDTDDPTQIKNDLLNAIVSSTDLSNEASIVLFTEDNSNKSGYSILWPNNEYSISAVRRSGNILEQILEEDGLDTEAVTKTAESNETVFYYRFVNLEYRSSSVDENSSTSHVEYERFYLLIYVDSSAYISFSNAMNAALIRSVVLSVIASAVISIIVAFPLFFSTRKLSRFAGRIGKGDFKPLKGHIVSRELSDLGDVMNNMAYKLEKSDIEQKTFFQNASHELRTPLMSIQGYAEGIKYGVFDDTRKDEAVDVIISETTRLSNLVENLLSISKMDMSKGGFFEVKKQILDVRELVEIVIEKVRGGFLYSGKELRNDIDLKQAFIFANENDIFRMLENIFSNCLRYARNEVRFTVFSQKEHVVFRISDDGEGISEEVLGHLFDRFAKGSDGKHGIGLALSKAIAEEHGGTITGFNNEDGGACFEIRIPLTDPKKQLSKMNNEK